MQIVGLLSAKFVLVFVHSVSDLVQLFRHGLVHEGVVVTSLRRHFSQLLTKGLNCPLFLIDVALEAIKLVIQSLQHRLIRVTLIRQLLNDSLSLRDHVTLQLIFLFQLAETLLEFKVFELFPVEFLDQV